MPLSGSGFGWMGTWWEFQFDMGFYSVVDLEVLRKLVHQLGSHSTNLHVNLITTLFSFMDLNELFSLIGG